MVSQTVTNVMGIIGGVVLSVCQAPQLLKLWRTKSASDLSYWYLYLYAIGLLFITVYLYLEAATVGWICEAVEFACGLLLIAAKYYMDNWGPLSWRAKHASSAGRDDSSAGLDARLAAGQSDGTEGSGGGAAGSGGGVSSRQVAASLPGQRELRERRRSLDMPPI